MLQVSGLTKSYGAIRAVDGVSFAIHAGEIYGLLGPNGAGKTTTISMLCGLLRPDAGTVVVAGEDFWLHPARCKKVLGVVPQEIALYEELTGRENLEFWGRLRQHVTPYLPPNWFLEAVRTTQFEGYAGGSWIAVSGRMLLLGSILTLLAAWRLRRTLEKGART